MRFVKVSFQKVTSSLEFGWTWCAIIVLSWFRAPIAQQLIDEQVPSDGRFVFKKKIAHSAEAIGEFLQNVSQVYIHRLYVSNITMSTVYLLVRTIMIMYLPKPCRKRIVPSTKGPSLTFTNHPYIPSGLGPSLSDPCVGWSNSVVPWRAEGFMRIHGILHLKFHNKIHPKMPFECIELPFPFARKVGTNSTWRTEVLKLGVVFQRSNISTLQNLRP